MDAEPTGGHLAEVPAWMAGSTDMILRVGQIDLRVHGHLLAAVSEVLSHAISCQKVSDCNKQQQESSVMLEDDPEVVAAALDYIYRRAFRRRPTTFKNELEAMRLAAFAHKYDAQDLTFEADSYLADSVGLAHLGAGPSDKDARLMLLEPSAEAASRKTCLASLAQLTTWDVFDYIAAADNFKLRAFRTEVLLILKDHKSILAKHRCQLELMEARTLASIIQLLA